TVKALEVLNLLATIPGGLVLGLGVPIVSGLGEVAVSTDEVSDHNTYHSCDQLRVVQDPHRVDLVSGVVFPAVADFEGEVGIRVRRVPGVVEEGRVKVRVVAALSEGFAGVETSVTLFRTQLGALRARGL